MVEESLEMLQAMVKDVLYAMASQAIEIREIKLEGEAAIKMREAIDRLEQRVDRIERRLELTDDA